MTFTETLTIQRPGEPPIVVEIHPHARESFVTWYEPHRQMDLYPLAWRRLGYEVIA